MNFNKKSFIFAKKNEMFFQIKSYLSFLMHSTTKYGVHSPFVYALVTKCFNTKTTTDKIKTIKAYKQFLQTNKQHIKVTDFGAGSRIFKTNKRRIADIAKNAGITTNRAALLARIVAYLDINNILEIGTSLGIGTLALGLGNSKAKITTMEGCPETIKIPQNNLKKYLQNNINFVIGEFEKTLPNVAENQQYDLVYFDGNHQKKPTIDYFKQCLKTVHNDTLFIFDDIHWSKEMEAAWEYIKTHKKVSLTIDTFYWGFVFFRQEQQEKEHFIIRL